ncbi:TetR/AcrR family transcriptional regulator [Flexivirga sp. B27]
MGNPDTRAQILGIARDRFLSGGYAGTSMRAIARDAGVDVALLSYHFSSKQGLFAASMELPVRPGDLIEEALDAPIDQWPARILRTVLRAWDDPTIGPVLVQTVLASAAQQEGPVGFVEFLQTELLDRIKGKLVGRDAEARATGILMTIAGLLMTRYVLKAPAMADLSSEQVVRIASPGIAIHLRGARVQKPAR